MAGRILSDFLKRRPLELKDDGYLQDLLEHTLPLHKTWLTWTTSTLVSGLYVHYSSNAIRLEKPRLIDRDGLAVV